MYFLFVLGHFYCKKLLNKHSKYKWFNFDGDFTKKVTFLKEEKFGGYYAGSLPVARPYEKCVVMETKFLQHQHTPGTTFTNHL